MNRFICIARQQHSELAAISFAPVTAQTRPKVDTGNSSQFRMRIGNGGCSTPPDQVAYSLANSLQVGLMNNIIRLSFFAFLFNANAIVAHAAVIFESGTLGTTGIPYSGLGGGTAPTGSAVSPDVFSGVRFQVSQTVVTTRIGGHFVHDTRASSSFFGAIVQLDSSGDFPNSINLSTPDVVATSLLTFPNQSAETFGNLGAVLPAGWYALVFGSGQFGATGSGAAVLNNPDIGTPSYIARVPGSGWINVSTLPGPFQNYRLVIEGDVIPEPTTLVAAMLGICCLFGVRSIRQ